MSLLEVRNLKKYFKTPGGDLHAVDDISFTLSHLPQNRAVWLWGWICNVISHSARNGRGHTLGLRYTLAHTITIYRHCSYLANDSRPYRYQQRHLHRIYRYRQYMGFYHCYIGSMLAFIHFGAVGKPFAAQT